jgi:DNA invertase Pin-like site-specific DNA recombinase
MLHAYAAPAEKERRLIGGRTKAALQAARAVLWFWVGIVSRVISRPGG